MISRSSASVRISRSAPTVLEALAPVLGVEGLQRLHRSGIKLLRNLFLINTYLSFVGVDIFRCLVCGCGVGGKIVLNAIEKLGYRSEFE